MMKTLAIVALSLTALPAVAAPPAPKLVVAISVDQFAGDLYKRYRPTYSGGLRRLSQGVTFTGYQSHAATETCPGHSTILTGRHPAGTGIVANEWIDRETNKSIYCVAVKGAPDDARGPQNLKAETYGDWLKKASPANRVFAVSGKDRAAINMGGHHGDGIYWWDEKKGFTTSSYTQPTTLEVTGPAETFNAATFAKWRAAPPKLWPDLPGRCTALEKPETFGKLAVSGKVPPEITEGVETGDFVLSKDFQRALRPSPTYDTLVLDFADQLIDQRHIGHGKGIDLLALSFSATDYIGHSFGGGGAEMCGQQAALDATLGRLFAKLDSLHVPYVVVLTADHGGSDPAERLKEKGIAATRIDSRAFVKQLNEALRQQLSLDTDAVSGDDPQQLVIRRDLDPALRARIRTAAIAWLKARPEVVKVLTPEEVVAAAPPKGKLVTKLTFAEKFHESYDAERSGDIQVVFVEHASYGVPSKTGDYVSGHGTPWDYDRRVPMLFWWKGVKPDARSEPVETVDIAPTLAAITHTPTTIVDGECLKVVAGVCK